MGRSNIISISKSEIRKGRRSLRKGVANVLFAGVQKAGLELREDKSFQGCIFYASVNKAILREHLAATIMNELPISGGIQAKVGQWSEVDF